MTKTPKRSNQPTPPDSSALLNTESMLNMNWMDDAATDGIMPMDLDDFTVSDVNVPSRPIPEYTKDGNPESDGRIELTWAQQQIKDAHKKERDRNMRNTDTEYWMCLVFQNREELDQFIQKTQWCDGSDKFVDGRKVARKLGVDLTLDKEPFGRQLKAASAKMMPLIQRKG